MNNNVPFHQFILSHGRDYHYCESLLVVEVLEWSENPTPFNFRPLPVILDQSANRSSMIRLGSPSCLSITGVQNATLLNGREMFYGRGKRGKGTVLGCSVSKPLSLRL